MIADVFAGHGCISQVHCSTKVLAASGSNWLMRSSSKFVYSSVVNRSAGSMLIETGEDLFDARIQGDISNGDVVESTDETGAWLTIPCQGGKLSLPRRKQGGSCCQSEQASS